jgi:photosystem II stability/assembly factor-like uncharacterized protein
MQRKPCLSLIFGQQESSILAILILMSFIYCSIPGFSYAQQKKTLHDLFSVSFPTEREGWVCGRWGTILHTADDGSTWAHQSSGTDYTLSSISFVDTQTGWAVGDGGTILHTKDGGKRWTKQKSPVPYFLMGVKSVTHRKGWIVTERTTILYTEDGGENWQEQFKDEDFILKRVSFCDEQNGWAAGEFGYIYHTDNGGVTWKKEAGEFTLSEETGGMEGENFLFDVVAIDSRTAWVVGIDGHAARTVDGGANWQKVTNGLPKTHLFGVTTDGQGLILIGGNSLLVTSPDGGETFRAAKVEPAITYGWIYGISSRGGKGFVAVGKGGWIYVSDAKGILWQKATY